LALKNEIVILKGYYENFLNSLCEAFRHGKFPWGFKRESDLNIVLENPERLIAFYVVNHGFAMIAKIGERVEEAEPFWSDELKEKRVIYVYRFFLLPLKISKCFVGANVCTEAFKPSEDCFIRAGNVQEFIASECGINMKKAIVQLGANVNVARECKAQKILEYLEKSPLLVDFKAAIEGKEASWDPLSECKNFYIEVTGSPYPGHIGRSLWSPATERYRYMERLEPGDCIFHYLKTSSSSVYRKMIVGVSRVSNKSVILSKNELVDKLRSLRVWNDEYAKFASNWLEKPKYKSFYFVELSGYIEFQRKISLDEFIKLTGIRLQSLRRYLVDLPINQAMKVLEPNLVGIKAKPTTIRKQFILENLAGKLSSHNIGELIILLHLLSGKNILLVGPPGSGKTSLLKNLLEFLNISYRLETGNPEWTPFDAIGGLLTTGSVREGFIFAAVKKSKEDLERNSRLYWLIIDEINRANVDLAFGKFFTLLDPVHRESERLEIPGAGLEYSLEVPFSFRVLATMNSYDRAILFKLGYALTRRFAVIDHFYLQELPRYLEEYSKRVKATSLRTQSGGSFEELVKSISVDYGKVWRELIMCRSSNKGVMYDCVTPIDFASELKSAGESEWRDRVYAIDSPSGRVMLDEVFLELVIEVNKKLREFIDYDVCPICPVQITPGLVGDALKYIAVGVYAYKKGFAQRAGVNLDAGAYALLLLDTAFSTYILPQLDILADYVSRERLKRGKPKASESREETTLTSILEKIQGVLENRGLIYSAQLVERIRSGSHVF
jgi:energy-coupling factor transporter ATP-binding protein EcfA2